MNVRPTLLRSWGETLGTSASIVGLGMITGILAARLLGPDDRGLLAVAMFWPGLIASLAFMSLGDATVYRYNNTTLDRERFTATVVATSLCLSIVALLCAAPVLPWLFGSERAEQIPLLLAYAMAFIPCYFVALALFAIDKSEQNFRRYNLLRFSNPLTYLIGICALWIFDSFDARNFIWAAWLGTAVNAALCLWCRRASLFALPSVREAALLLRQGLTFHAATVLIAFSAQADRLVVMTFFQNADIGLYVVALTLASAATSLVANSMNTVLFPSIAAAHDRLARIDRLETGIRRTALLVSSGSIAAAITLPPLLPVIFGEAFRDARPLTAILVLAIAPMTLRLVIVACLRAFGDGRTGVLVEAVAVLSFAIMVLPALIIGDLWAIGVAFGVANAAALLLTAYLLQRRYGVGIASWLLPNARMIQDVHVILTRLQQRLAA